MSILSQIGIAILIITIILILIRSDKKLVEASREGENFVDEWALKEERRLQIMEAEKLRKRQIRQEERERKKRLLQARQIRKQEMSGAYQERESEDMTDRTWPDEQDQSGYDGRDWQREQSRQLREQSPRQREHSRQGYDDREWQREQSRLGYDDREWQREQSRLGYDDREWQREQDQSGYDDSVWSGDRIGSAYKEDGNPADIGGSDRQAYTAQLRMEKNRSVNNLVLIELDEDRKQVKRISVKKVPFCIGRESANDLVIDDLCIAKRHCRIVEGQTGLVMEDGGSRNKVLVNGNPAAQILLKDGLIIGIGNREYLVELI